MARCATTDDGMEVEVVSEEGGDTVTPTSTTSTGGVSTDVTTDRVTTTDAGDSGEKKNQGIGTKNLIVMCHKREMFITCVPRIVSNMIPHHEIYVLNCHRCGCHRRCHSRRYCSGAHRCTAPPLALLQVRHELFGTSVLVWLSAGASVLVSLNGRYVIICQALL